MEFLLFFEDLVWLGLAAVGFAILFNVPVRGLLVVFIMGALGGGLKLFAMSFGANVVFSSFSGAFFVGFLSIYAAHIKHIPPFVFAIPSVIPMVPGAFAYRMMLGIIRLTDDIDSATFQTLLEETVSNGLKALFILMSLALGVSAPMLLTRKDSAKNIKLHLNSDKQ